MPDFDVELGVGDSLRIGNRILTVIDIQHGEVSVRIDPIEESDCDEFVPECGSQGRLRPR
jgi:hypothetical protein